MRAKAVQSLRPKAQWVLKGNKLEWLDTIQIQPTKKEIDDEIIKLEAEYRSTEYQRLRKTEYDKLNQDELRYNDLVNNTNIWVEAINEIKSKYPKPE